MDINHFSNFRQMSNFIITKNPKYFSKIGNYNFCNLEDMKLQETIAIDLETTGLSSFKDSIFSVQIGTGKNNYLIDLQTYSTGLFTAEELKFEDVIPFIKNKILVGHNIKFDMSFFYKHSFFPKKVFDTMIASLIYNNGDDTVFSHSFGKVMLRELQNYVDKTEQKNIHKLRLSTAKAIEYCFNDVDRLLELFETMSKNIREVGSWDSFELNCQFLRALVYMERCGLPIDIEMWKKKMKEDKIEFLADQREVIDFIYDNAPFFRDMQLNFFETKKRVTVNLASPKQMIAVFKEFKIPCRNSEEKDSIAEDVIDKSSHPFVEIWLKFVGTVKTVTTYGQNIIDSAVNGRLYTNFKPIVSTCRISTRKGETSFLTFPAEALTRDCFRSKPGYKIVAADYAGQEAICLTMLSKDEALLDSVNRGMDLHCMFARVLFPEITELTDEEITSKHKEKRDFAKAPRFLFSFGGNAHTLHTKKNIPMKRAVEIEKGFKELHATMFQWGEDKLKESIKTGYIQYTYGFRLKLPFFDRFKELEREIKNKDNEFWEIYKEGKLQHKTLEANLEERKEDLEIPLYEITDELSYNFYKKHSPTISRFFSLRSEYLRLCLNAPSQGMASHMTKKAMVSLFDYILEKGHINRALICNMPHDEIIMEIEDNLVTEYESVLENIMVEEANSFLDTDVVKMKCDAFGGLSWYLAKIAKNKYKFE